MHMSLLRAPRIAFLFELTMSGQSTRCSRSFRFQLRDVVMRFRLGLSFVNVMLMIP